MGQAAYRSSLSFLRNTLNEIHATKTAEGGNQTHTPGEPDGIRFDKLTTSLSSTSQKHNYPQNELFTEGSQYDLAPCLANIIQEHTLWLNSFHWRDVTAKHVVYPFAGDGLFKRNDVFTAGTLIILFLLAQVIIGCL